MLINALITNIFKLSFFFADAFCLRLFEGERLCGNGLETHGTAAAKPRFSLTIGLLRAAYVPKHHVNQPFYWAKR
jgi:hypothetical protein